VSVVYRCGFDIDDVLVPWYIKAHEICRIAGLAGDVVPTTWRPYEEYPSCTKEQWLEALDGAILAGSLYLDTPPDNDAVRALRSLYFDGHEVYLITARGIMGDAELIAKHTFRWLERHAIPYKSISFTREKGPKARQLGLDFFIDDNEDNWREVGDAISGAHDSRSFLLDRPWNQGATTIPQERVSSVQQYVDIIKEAANRE